MATEEQFSWAKAGNFISGARKMAEDLVPGLLAPGGQALEKVVTGGVQKVKEVISKPAVGEKPAVGVPRPPEGVSSGGRLSLSGSVGRGGKNKPTDVLAVQQALNRRANAGLVADGASGGKTIAAIENFQRSIGQSKPDGRVDAGGATARALGLGGTAPPQPTPNRPEPKPVPIDPTQPKPVDPSPQPPALQKAITLVREASGLASDLKQRVTHLGIVVGKMVLTSPCKLDAAKVVASIGGTVAAIDAIVVELAAEPETLGAATLALIPTIFGLIKAVDALVSSIQSLDKCLDQNGDLEDKQEIDNTLARIKGDIKRLQAIASELRSLAS